MSGWRAAFLAVLVAVCGVYGGILPTGWHFDDDKAVRENLGVLNDDWGGARGFLFGRGTVTASYVLCKQFAADSPVVYHAMDLALHAGCAIGLLALLRAWCAARGTALSPFWAAVAVLFWAIHPAQSQGVVYIAQRYERMCLLFYVLTLFGFLKGLLAVSASPERRQAAAAWFALSLLAWRLALGSKENAVTLPLAALLVLVSLARGPAPVLAGVTARRAGAVLALHAALCLALFAVPPSGVLGVLAAGGILAASARVRARDPEGTPAGAGRRRFAAAAAWVAVLQVATHLDVRNQLEQNLDVLASAQGERSFHGDRGRRETRGFLDALGDQTVRNEYFLTQARVIARYVSLAVLPNRLNVDYDWQPVWTLADAPDVVLLWILWGGLLAWGGIALSRSGSPVGFGVLWYLVALAPTASLFRLADLVFEHRIYLPSAGLVWLVAAAAPALSRAAGAAARPLAVSALAILGVFTIHRVQDWTDDLTLYSDSVRKAPTGFRQRTNLGLGHEHRKDYVRAEREHLMSVRMFKGFLWVEPFGNLGNVYLATGQLEKARRCYETVLHMSGDYKARVMLAHLYARMGDAAASRGEGDAARDAYQGALAHAMLALRANPRDTRIHPVVEVLLSAASPPGSDLTTLFRMRMEAIEEAHRQHAEGKALARQGRAGEAIARFDAAIALFLPVGMFHADRGRLKADALGDVDGAIADMEMALQFPPCDQEMFKRLAEFYKRKGEPERARALGARFKESFPHLFYPREWGL